MGEVWSTSTLTVSLTSPTTSCCTWPNIGSSSCVQERQEFTCNVNVGIQEILPIMEYFTKCKIHILQAHL